MYRQTITLFNYLDSIDNYSSTVINGVEVQPKYATIPKIYQTDNDSKVLVIIRYQSDESGRYVNTENGKKYYKTPKQWKENPEYFTLNPNFDFLIVGEYIPENPEINLNELKNELDNIFVINEIKDFADDLKHFEIIAN